MYILVLIDTDLLEHSIDSIVRLLTSHNQESLTALSITSIPGQC